MERTQSSTVRTRRAVRSEAVPVEQAFTGELLPGAGTGPPSCSAACAHRHVACKA
jgi:hypothetical protein